MSVPQVSEHRTHVVVHYLLWNGARVEGRIPDQPGELGVKLSELRTVCVAKIHRPFLARTLALQGSESLAEITARFAELRAQLNLPANPDVDYLLARDQMGGVTLH